MTTITTSLSFIMNYERRVVVSLFGKSPLVRDYLRTTTNGSKRNMAQAQQVLDRSEHRHRHHRRFTTSTGASSKPQQSLQQQQEEEPFYGKPRYGNSESTSSSTSSSSSLFHSRYQYHKHQHRSIFDRITIAIHNATTAFADPTRADAVAALGEITGQITLQRIHQRMMDNETGRLILQDRPVVSKATIPYMDLIASAPHVGTETGGSYRALVNNNDDITFGQAYGLFLKSHGFDPDERDEVKYIEDETLAYVMLRYRQVGRNNRHARNSYVSEQCRIDVYTGCVL
jgi:hypothetical protein